VNTFYIYNSVFINIIVVRCSGTVIRKFQTFPALVFCAADLISDHISANSM